VSIKDFPAVTELLVCLLRTDMGHSQPCSRCSLSCA